MDVRFCCQAHHAHHAPCDAEARRLWRSRGGSGAPEAWRVRRCPCPALQNRGAVRRTHPLSGRVRAGCERLREGLAHACFTHAGLALRRSAGGGQLAQRVRQRVRRRRDQGCRRRLRHRGLGDRPRQDPCQHRNREGLRVLDVLPPLRRKEVAELRRRRRPAEARHPRADRPGGIRAGQRLAGIGRPPTCRAKQARSQRPTVSSDCCFTKSSGYRTPNRSGALGTSGRAGPTRGTSTTAWW